MTILICECKSLEHQLVFTKDEDNVYRYVHLVPESSIFKRIWYAIKYIFGYRCQYGHFDEFIFNKDDCSKLKEIASWLT